MCVCIYIYTHMRICICVCVTILKYSTYDSFYIRDCMIDYRLYTVYYILWCYILYIFYHVLYPIYYMLSWCCLGVCTKALAPTTPEGDWHKGRAHAAPSIYFYTCVYVCIHIYTCVHIENRSQPNQPTEPAFKPPLLRAPRVETVCLRSVMDAHTAPSSPAVMAYYRSNPATWPRLWAGLSTASYDSLWEHSEPFTAREHKMAFCRLLKFMVLLSGMAD